MTTDDTQAGPSGVAQDFTKMSVPEMMKLYYGWLFPHQEMYKWLAYGNDGKHPQSDATFFQRRELCFTLDGDIFVRYQSFKDGTEMQAAIRDRCPAKIDIGPVYNVDPQRRAAYANAGAGSQGFIPVQRELVFDIDLTDYDDVRTCGKEGHICTKCWPLMAAAVAILDRGLREDFGFKHILFVYSGRRGVHCWVCDERARKLTDEQRASIANYFCVYKGQEKGLAKLALGLEDHPAVARAYEVLENAFVERILPEQRLLEDATHMNTILSYIPDEDIKSNMKRKWSSAAAKEGEESVRRWEMLQEAVKNAAAAKSRAKDSRTARQLEKSIKEIIFAYSYPRLDMEVSKKMNHLLKAPFCVHPKTGKVCVPIDPACAWEFDPDEVCTVGVLLNQISANKASAKTGEEWQATDMAEAVDTFRRCFLDALQVDVRQELANKAREAAAAPTLAW